MKAVIPYGTGNIETEDDSIKAVFESRLGDLQQLYPEDDIVLEAMRRPIGSSRLSDLAIGKRNAVIIISDHTRPVPSRHIIPFMLQELRAANPDIDITLLVATGCHRATDKSELRAKLGDEIVNNEKIIVHDCDNEDDLVNIGKLPSGADLIVDRYAVQTDLLIAEGFIEPHFFAGFSGGRKSILPGICSRKTVLGNHCSKFIDDPNAIAGVLDGNPINEDMVAAARMAKLAYIVNVVIDEDKRAVAAFAGDPIEAHRAGCDYLSKFCEVKLDKKRKIVITSNGGYPIDQNVYQAVKGISTAALAVSDGGAIIMCAECRDGVCGDVFYHKLKECDTISDLLAEIRATPMDETLPDQWQYQILAKAIEKYKIFFVTREELRQEIEDMKMTYEPDLETAIKDAKDYAGWDAEISVIPNGVGVFFSKPDEQ